MVRFVGVEARADVLNIEDQGVQTAQHLGRGPGGVAVEAEDLDAGGGVGRVADSRAVFVAGDAVLGRK